MHTQDDAPIAEVGERRAEYGVGNALLAAFAAPSSGHAGARGGALVVTGDRSRMTLVPRDSVTGIQAAESGAVKKAVLMLPNGSLYDLYDNNRAMSESVTPPDDNTYGYGKPLLSDGNQYNSRDGFNQKKNKKGEGVMNQTSVKAGKSMQAGSGVTDRNRFYSTLLDARAPKANSAESLHEVAERLLMGEKDNAKLALDQLEALKKTLSDKNGSDEALEALTDYYQEKIGVLQEREEAIRRISRDTCALIEKKRRNDEELIIVKAQISGHERDVRDLAIKLHTLKRREIELAAAEQQLRKELSAKESMIVGGLYDIILPEANDHRGGGTVKAERPPQQQTADKPASGAFVNDTHIRDRNDASAFLKPVGVPPRAAPPAAPSVTQKAAASSVTRNDVRDNIRNNTDAFLKSEDVARKSADVFLNDNDAPAAAPKEENIVNKYVSDDPFLSDGAPPFVAPKEEKNARSYDNDDPFLSNSRSPAIAPEEEKVAKRYDNDDIFLSNSGAPIGAKKEEKPVSRYDDDDIFLSNSGVPIGAKKEEKPVSRYDDDDIFLSNSGSPIGAKKEEKPVSRYDNDDVFLSNSGSPIGAEKEEKNDNQYNGSNYNDAFLSGGRDAAPVYYEPITYPKSVVRMGGKVIGEYYHDGSAVNKDKRHYICNSKFLAGRLGYGLRLIRDRFCQETFTEIVKITEDTANRIRENGRFHFEVSTNEILNIKNLSQLASDLRQRNWDDAEKFATKLNAKIEALGSNYDAMLREQMERCSQND